MVAVNNKLSYRYVTSDIYMKLLYIYKGLASLERSEDSIFGNIRISYTSPANPIYYNEVRYNCGHTTEHPISLFIEEHSSDGENHRYMINEFFIEVNKYDVPYKT